MSDRECGSRAIVAALRAALGESAVLDCASGDVDPRTSRHVSGRPIGEPLAWTRPRDTASAAAVVRLAREHGVNVVPVGSATTFWDGLRVDGTVVLDTLALREPLRIDPVARVALVGAGTTVRELDIAARAHGLCVAARPDAAGDTPLGSMLAVGSTAGLGLGFGTPVSQFSGATVVLGTGDVHAVGAAHVLQGFPYTADGLPHALSSIAGAEGRGALVTEVGVLLRHAPFVARVTHELASEARAAFARVTDAFAIARAALDRGELDTLRVEYIAEGAAVEGRASVVARTYSDRSVEAAAEAAAGIAARLDDAGWGTSRVERETDAARAGEAPDYAFHWSFGPGEHRARLLDAAFWGLELAVPWGAGATRALACFERLHAELARVEPLVRRLGVYPGHHQISIGVQVLVPRRDALVRRTIDVLHAAQGELLALGVPYRRGELWRDAVEARLSARSNATSLGLEGGFERVMDPFGTFAPRRRTSA